MPRTIRIVSPADETEALISDMRGVAGLVSIQVSRGASLQPAGDVILVDSNDTGLVALMHVLDGRVRRRPEVIVTTAVPAAMLTRPQALALRRGPTEQTWEEMDLLIQQDSGMTPNALAVMAISGFLAAIGLAVGALHLVIAGMLIAPAFEPISRVSLGIVTRSRAWRAGIRDTISGYVALAAGAALAAGCMLALGTPLLGGKYWYDRSSALVAYWTSFDPTVVLSIAAAGIGGAVLIVARRSTLTGGAVVALGLVPTASLIPLAFAAGDVGLVARAAARWSIEAGIVVVASLFVFGWKRARVQPRRMIG